MMSTFMSDRLMVTVTFNVFSAHNGVNSLHFAVHVQSISTTRNAKS